MGKLGQFEMLALNDSCPCGHSWAGHDHDSGCHTGWEYNGPDPGIASKDGCMCQLAHVAKSPALIDTGRSA